MGTVSQPDVKRDGIDVCEWLKTILSQCALGFSSSLASSPAVNFINVLLAHFSHKILAPKITKLCFGFEIFWHQNIGKKADIKCWWNWHIETHRLHLSIIEIYY